MTRQTLAQMLRGQSGPPVFEGTVEAVLRDADGGVVQRVCQKNLVTEYFRALLTKVDIEINGQYVFINETTEQMHVKRNAMRTTLPGVWQMAVTPTLDGPNRIWTYQTTFAAPPAERTIRVIGLTRQVETTGFTNVKVGPLAICAATSLSTPIVQPTSSTLEVSYRLAIQRT